MRWFTIPLLIATLSATPLAAQEPEAFYDDWKALYLAEGCGTGRAYVDVAADGKPVGGGTASSVLTVSEAHGYGMLALVMMADHDPDAHRLFDGMLRYFLDHPAASGDGLMAWTQGRDCRDSAGDVGGGNSATDGDLDIAYALALASRRWGDHPTDYGAEARRMLDVIMAREVLAGSTVLLGDWVLAGDDRTYDGTTRTSDFMVSHFRGFADFTGVPRWLEVRDATYDIIAKVTTPHGLVPDFVQGLPDAPRPVPPMFLEGAHDGDYSWNAVRYPWRLALDHLLYDEPRALEALSPLNDWIVATTEGDPQRIADTYRLDGSVPQGVGTGNMAFVSMFAVSASIEPRLAVWHDALLREMTARPIEDADYYGNTLKLLALIAMSGRWGKLSAP